MPKDEKNEEKQMVVTLPQGVVLAIVTGILSSIGTSGGMTMWAGVTPDDVKTEVIGLHNDIDRLSEKIDEIYNIVDAAHPRTGTTPGGP